MSKILERALAHYDNRPTKSVAVPEWAEEGKEFLVHFKTPNLATLSKIKREAGEDEVKQMAMLVVHCSLDEKGTRIFEKNIAWSDLFTGVDPVVVQRIGAAIMADFKFNEEAVDEAEKN